MKADETEVIALLDSAINLFSKPLPEDAGPYLFERAQHKENKEMYKEAVDDYDEYYHVVNGKVNDLFYYYRDRPIINKKLQTLLWKIFKSTGD